MEKSRALVEKIVKHLLNKRFFPRDFFIAKLLPTAVEKEFSEFVNGRSLRNSCTY